MALLLHFLGFQLVLFYGFSRILVCSACKNIHWTHSVLVPSYEYMNYRLAFELWRLLIVTIRNSRVVMLNCNSQQSLIEQWIVSRNNGMTHEVTKMKTHIFRYVILYRITIG